MPGCRSCDARDVAVLLDFGPQPPSNRFERPQDAPVERHPLVVAQCQACALVQLSNPMPPAMVKSRFDWLTYNEPEGHLDDLVGRLRALPQINSDSRIVGLTYKDDSTLARFNRLGHVNTYRYDPAADLGISDPCAGLESLQAAFDAGSAERLARRHGRADLLLARHILEHAHSPKVFVQALKKLAKPGGYLVCEVPDATKFIQACDYSFIWEEHVTYLSHQTLGSLLERAGIALADTYLYPYPLEDSLIAVARNVTPAAPTVPRAQPAFLDDGRRFAARYTATRTKLKSLLAGWRSRGRHVAVFGAGHLAAKFINLLELAEQVECVIDDNPHKQALLMPGSRLRIRGSELMASGAVDVCLLSLNPESEQKVRTKYASYLERGGSFRSIFALSPHSVQQAAA